MAEDGRLEIGEGKLEAGFLNGKKEKVVNTSL